MRLSCGGFNLEVVQVAFYTGEVSHSPSFYPSETCIAVALMDLLPAFPKKRPQEKNCVKEGFSILRALHTRLLFLGTFLPS